ncbi:MAG: hypothetical protein KF778_05525 [Rhodocyclaceae bacterium]|nr:hypothetical protein [Rhodocyclaceae bacterium]MBX3667843.1 hypothetical protein [Rhodocyclaceae bacterium]
MDSSNSIKKPIGRMALVDLVAYIFLAIAIGVLSSIALAGAVVLLAQNSEPAARSAATLDAIGGTAPQSSADLRAPRS